MKPNKKNLFGVFGRVHPSEYDWKTQFHQIAKKAYKNADVFMTLDVGKVLGLADAYEEILDENIKLRQAAKKLVELDDFIKNNPTYVGEEWEEAINSLKIAVEKK